ncbi:hypothetical protein J6590_089287, partial [Homalodisca vitripennis]
EGRGCLLILLPRHFWDNGTLAGMHTRSAVPEHDATAARHQSPPHWSPHFQCSTYSRRNPGRACGQAVSTFPQRSCSMPPSSISVVLSSS